MYPNRCPETPQVYNKPCCDPKVIHKYHVECERVEVPMQTHVIHHKIRKPVFVTVPYCTEEYLEHAYIINDCCKPVPVPYQQHMQHPVHHQPVYQHHAQHAYQQPQHSCSCGNKH